MTEVLFNVVGLCSMIVGLATLVLLLAPNTGNVLEATVHRWRERDFAIPSNAVVQTILRGSTSVIDLFVSPILYRRTRIIRTATASLLLLVGSLGIAGLLEGNAFGITEAPWTAYSEAINDLIETKRSADEQNEKAIAQLKTWLKPHWVVTYSIVSTAVVIFFSILGDYISLVFSRSVLLGLRETRSKATVAASFVGLSTLLVVLSVGVFFIVACISSPYVAAPMIVAPLVFDSTIIAASLGVIGTLALAAFLVGLWVWAVTATAILPGAFVLAMWGLGTVVAPLSVPVGRTIGHMIELAATHRFGVIGFLLALLSGFAAILGGLLAIWPGT